MVQTTSIPGEKSSPPARSLGLDAMRGLAILLMVLSAHMPRMLPNWMYHGNNPQYIVDDQDQQTNSPLWQKVEQPWSQTAGWIGMTWVDVVFPMFLFAMGAAIPLSLAGRMQRGDGRLILSRSILVRFILLVGFAVYVQQCKPSAIASPVTTSALLLSLLAFVVLFALLTRLPRPTPAPVVRLVRVIGLISAVLVLAVINTTAGHDGLNWSRNDIIILLLAWNYLAASLLWLWASNRPWLCWTLGLLIALVGHEVNLPEHYRLVSADFWNAIGWTLNLPGHLLDWRCVFRTDAAWANLSPLYDFGMFSKMWLVLPGMLTGEAIRRAMGKTPANQQVPAVKAAHWLLVFLCMLMGCYILLAGLMDVYTQWSLPWGIELANPYAASLALPCFLLGTAMMWRWQLTCESTRLVRNVLTGAAVCATLGIVLAMLPGWDSAYFEGGPCKVPGTFSWYLASTGLVGMLLGLFIYWIDIKSWHRSASLLVYTGQNPMLAYMAARSLLVPILLLPVIQTATAQRLSLDDWIYGQMFDYLGEGYSPYWKLSYGMLKVLCLSGCVAWLTCRKVIWRA